MPELKLQGNIHHDQHNKSIAIVNLAYCKDGAITDHEGKSIDSKKLNEHLINFLTPKLYEQIKYASYQIKECTVSETGAITYKIERWDHKEVILTESNISYGLVTSINIALQIINTSLANSENNKIKEKADTVKPEEPAKQTAPSLSLFTNSSAKSLYAEIEAAITKANEAPRAKL